MTAQLFTWDPEKVRTNIAKHGISFDTAVQVFLDPFLVTEPAGIESGELRWRSTGLIGATLVLLVAHATTDEADGAELIRIISARRATPRERKRYEEARRRDLPA